MEDNQHTKKVAEYYEKRWDFFKKWYYAEETLGIHYAYFDENTRNIKEAIYRMNDLVGEKLDLKQNQPKKVLDAGCGVGGTIIYLGKKYPKSQFFGITITPDQVQKGKEFIKKRNLKNVNILLNDFNKTDFPSNFFDGVFAIESIGYSEKIEDVIKEMVRILKPSGKLVILEGFRTDISINPILYRFYKNFLYGRGYQDIELPRLKYFVNLLNKSGFNNVLYKDISNNVSRTSIRSLIFAIPFFVSFNIKKFLTFGKYDKNRNYFEFSMSVPIFIPIIALKRISRYYMITANKRIIYGNK